MGLVRIDRGKGRETVRLYECPFCGETLKENPTEPDIAPRGQTKIREHLPCDAYKEQYS